ncbi:hypothetical protein SAMN05892877_14117 [Rhizobium subbaraonis]|uniref:Uncharacterized protein n=1 Tax=Rhizobium subbaraonis TaxID=908946 RepID=A0A285V2C7_9HYPH|nr:hypothetical protein [Rhizobium subbaraonis]SOC48173.1 hypothetical protein SAMN05892877_14117 [Rhizobium subbaraonis]
MSKDTTNTTPTHHVYVVEGKGDTAFWTKIGAAWQHADGNGLNITLTLLPLDGRVVIRTAKAGETTRRRGRGQ